MLKSGTIRDDQKTTIKFDEAVIARYVKIEPKAYSGGPSFRFELLGCGRYTFYSPIVNDNIKQNISRNTMNLGSHIKSSNKIE